MSSKFQAIASGLVQRDQIEKDLAQKAREAAHAHWSEVWKKNGEPEWNELKEFFGPFLTQYAASTPFSVVMHKSTDIKDRAYVVIRFQVTKKQHSMSDSGVLPFVFYYDLTTLTWYMTKWADYAKTNYLDLDKKNGDFISKDLSELFVGIVARLISNKNDISPLLYDKISGK